MKLNHCVYFFFFLNPAMDRNLCTLVPKGYVLGYVPPERHRTLGWREVQADSKV